MAAGRASTSPAYMVAYDPRVQDACRIRVKQGPLLVWIVDEAKDLTHVIFVDPHGLHHGELAGNADKFAALAALRAWSDQDDFRARRIRLDGRLLTTMPVAQIPDAGERSQAELEAIYPLIFQERSYVAHLLAECVAG